MKSNVATVLLSNAQVATLRLMQERERAQSPLGVAPSIHVIARSLMEKVLKQEGF